MPVSNFIVIRPIVVETFHKKPTNVNLMVALEEKSGNYESGQASSSGDNRCLFKMSWLDQRRGANMTINSPYKQRITSGASGQTPGQSYFYDHQLNTCFARYDLHQAEVKFKLDIRQLDLNFNVTGSMLFASVTDQMFDQPIDLY